jgi:hypothetical protein
LSNKDIQQSLQDKSNQFDFGALGKVGLWVALNKSSLLKFDIGYKHGLGYLSGDKYGFGTPLKYKDNFVISKDYKFYETLLQSTNQGLRNVYVGLSFVSTICGKSK